MAQVYPVKEVVLPKDLKGCTNGKLPKEVLRKTTPYGEGHWLADQAWRAMCAAAKADGLNLTHVGAYRPFTDQLKMFKSRYKLVKQSRNISRTWKNQTWWLIDGVAPSSSPGGSNHGWGIAYDAACLVGKKVLPITADPDGRGTLKSGLEWLLKNADKYGFSWEVREGAQAEAWHIRYYCGDNIPQAVKDFVASQPPKK